MKKIVFLFLILFLFVPVETKATTLGSKLSGMILLDVERNGEAWYINPLNKKRYYLGRPTDAFQIMRELGLGISEDNFKEIQAGSVSLKRKLAGRIVLQVEKNGEAWYIHPITLDIYYLGRPIDAFSIMREVGLGITKVDLAKIDKNSYDETTNKYSNYEHKVISTTDGDFKIDVVEIDLENPNLKIITDTGDDYNCKDNCIARGLEEYVFEHEAFVAFNGSYFCAYDNCGGKNYYFFPVFNSTEKKMINEDQLKYWTTGPIIAFDTFNKFYFFKDSRDFENVEAFEKKYKVKLQAAIGNKPGLIENGKNILIDFELDEKQKNVKGVRNAIGYKNNKLYLAVVYNATVPNLANVMKALNMEYAMNTDGGYSSALYYNDEFIVGPGRDIPNVILFIEK